MQVSERVVNQVSGGVLLFVRMVVVVILFEVRLVGEVETLPFPVLVGDQSLELLVEVVDMDSQVGDNPRVHLEQKD